MIVDSSAIIAIFEDEADRRNFTEAIAAARVCRISLVNYVECRNVLQARRGDTAAMYLDLFLERAEIERRGLDDLQARLACEAFRRFGKGIHRAGLNFGDCFAYALAKAMDEPLLFKGTDFAATDLVPAIEP